MHYNQIRKQTDEKIRKTIPSLVRGWRVKNIIVREIRRGAQGRETREGLFFMRLLRRRMREFMLAVAKARVTEDISSPSEDKLACKTYRKF